MSDLKKLYLYNLLTSASLAVVADFIFIDLLLLRIGTGFAAIGAIKALIFFLPVLSYQLAAPLLNRWRHEESLCACCYVLRALIPALIPAAAVLGADDAALRWMSAALLPAALMLATFANNALMIVYHERFPQGKFNRCSGIVYMCFCLPGLALGFPASLLFDRVSKLADEKFFAAYLGAMLVCGVFQIPAFFIMRSLGRAGQTERSAARGAELPAPGGMLKPYRDRGYLGTLLVTFLHALAVGGGTAYIAGFCLKILDVSVSATFVLRTAAAGAGVVMLPVAGRFADRFGYRKVFLCGGVLMTIGAVLPAAFPQLWMLPLCALVLGRRGLSGRRGDADVRAGGGEQTRLGSRHGELHRRLQRGADDGDGARIAGGGGVVLGAEAPRGLGRGRAAARLRGVRVGSGADDRRGAAIVPEARG